MDLPNLLNLLAIGILLGGIYAMVAVGLNLIFGVIRVVNFAHGELVMLGMYGAWQCASVLKIDPYLSVLIVLPLLFGLGLLIQRFVIQPLQSEHMMQMFATFALLTIGQNAVLVLTRGEGHSVNTRFSTLALEIGDVRLTATRLIILASVTLIAIGLHLFLARTLVGKSIRAVTQDRAAARLMGINVERTFAVTFGIGAALAGLAGVLLAPIYTLSPGIGGNFIFAAFAVVVLGGLGSVAGAYAGGMIVGVVEAFAGYFIDPELKQAVWFLIFLAVLVFRPSGLFGQVGAEEVGMREQT